MSLSSVKPVCDLQSFGHEAASVHGSPGARRSLREIRRTRSEQRPRFLTINSVAEGRRQASPARYPSSFVRSLHVCCSRLRGTE